MKGLQMNSDDFTKAVEMARKFLGPCEDLETGNVLFGTDPQLICEALVNANERLKFLGAWSAGHADISPTGKPYGSK
jgi:hypothetical protein